MATEPDKPSEASEEIGNKENTSEASEKGGSTVSQGDSWRVTKRGFLGALGLTVGSLIIPWWRVLADDAGPEVGEYTPPSEEEQPIPPSEDKPAEDTPSAEVRKEPQSLAELGKMLGISFGTTIVASDNWSNLEYQRIITQEFSLFSPIDCTIVDAVKNQLGKYQIKTLARELIKMGNTLRLYNLFWHADHRDTSDPLWIGAPELGKLASAEYRDKIGKYMDDKVRWVLVNAADVKELGFANEALWEFQGNTGWEDSPFRRAFGDYWLIEAYVRTYKVAQEMGRIPGKDLALFYSDYNYEAPNRKADFVFSTLQQLRKEAAVRLGLPDIPLVVDMQLHVDFNNPPKAGELYAGEVTYEGLKANFQRFGQLGPVWIGEWTIRGYSREQVNSIVSTVIKAAIDSGKVKSFTFWELMGTNGYYSNGDLLFDAPGGTFAKTTTYNILFSELKRYSDRIA